VDDAGSGDEDTAGAAAALDGRGDLSVVGVTSSGDFPVSRGAFQPVFGGGDIDGLVARIGPLG
jgi:hypothetical protein